MNQESLSLTVYNSDLALVRDSRTFRIEDYFLKIDGLVTEFSWDNVSTGMNPASVIYKSESTHLIEQNYRYDLANINSLLERYLEKDVQIIIRSRDGQIIVDESYSGKILAVANGHIEILEQDDGSIMLAPPGEVVLPELPDGVRSRPALVMMIEASETGEHSAELMYLTSGLSWSANYVANISPDAKTVDIAGWLAITNNCGIPFEHANIKCVAGDVNKVRETFSKGATRGVTMEACYSAAPAVEEGELGDYQTYKCSNPSTVNNKETKQLLFLDSRNVPCDKQYVFSYSWTPGMGRYEVEKETPVDVRLVIPELEKACPKGMFRMYQEDSHGDSEFIGEDRIEHSPKKSRVFMKIGKAFNIKARRLIESAEYKKSYRKERVNVFLHNYSEQDVVVQVRENLGANWEIMDKSHEYEEMSAFKIRFNITVPAGEEVKVSYYFMQTFE